MVKFKGLCPSLKKSVEFDVTEIIELPTKRGIKYQIKGDYEGRTCSTFTSKAKALALREEMGGRTMSAEEDMTGQAHQEDGVRPLRGDIQPLAEGQEPSAELPLKETVSQPITGTDVGVEPIESLELPDLPESSMETQFDETPAMEGDIEIASMMPEGDGQSIGNNTPMNPDVPLHAEETSEEVGQEEPSAEQLPLKETVPEDFSPADSQVSPLDDLSVSMADPVSRMEVEFDQAPEIIAEFSLAMPQPFGDGRSIGNITPMNPDVPFASENDDDYDDDELDEEEEYEMLMRENEALQREEENERIVRAIRKDRGDEYYAESLEFNADPLDETSLEVPPAVVFIEKIPPTVWENMTVETQMEYAETGDENLLVCPQCGITKGELRGIGGYCAVTDPEGEVYDSMVDCPYQKHFAPAHWVDSEIVVGHITPEEIEVAERLSPEIDMPMKSAGTSDLLYTTIPFFVWDKINSLVGAGVQAFPDYSGLNYTVQYYGNQKNHLENLVDVAEGETDIMFGSERYHATVLASEDGGYYIKTDSLRPYGAEEMGYADNCKECGRFTSQGCDSCSDFVCESCCLTPDSVPVLSNDSGYVSHVRGELSRYDDLCKECVSDFADFYEDSSFSAEEDKGRYGHMFDYPIVYANDSSNRRGYLIGYADGAIWNTGIMYGGIERNRDFINDVGQQRLKRMKQREESTTSTPDKSSTDDPDFDPEKADRNKDGVISDWERAVGNAVAKGIRESREKKGAESYQVGDEGMFEGGEIRILNIEDNSSQGKQNVYFYTYLDDEGNSDGFIHTTNERKLMNQFSMFPRERNAETFESDPEYDGMNYHGDLPYDVMKDAYAQAYEERQQRKRDEWKREEMRKYGGWYKLDGDWEDYDYETGVYADQFGNVIAVYWYFDMSEFEDNKVGYNDDWDGTLEYDFNFSLTDPKGYVYWKNKKTNEILAKAPFTHMKKEPLPYKERRIPMNAETFDVEFDDWAEQEMLTHGKDVSFKEWAKEEGEKHGDMDLTDWAEEEEESHDERYGAETFESPATKDKSKTKTIATLLGAGALAALLAPEHLKKFFNR